MARTPGRPARPRRGRSSRAQQIKVRPQHGQAGGHLIGWFKRRSQAYHLRSSLRTVNTQPCSRNDTTASRTVPFATSYSCMSVDPDGLAAVHRRGSVLRARRRSVKAWSSSAAWHILWSGERATSLNRADEPFVAQPPDGPGRGETADLELFDDLALARDGIHILRVLIYM